MMQQLKYTEFYNNQMYNYSILFKLPIENFNNRVYNNNKNKDV